MITVDSMCSLCGRLKGRRVAVACGVFDGLHRGHQCIIAALRRLCDETGAVPAILTFDPHPLAILAPGKEPARLTTRSQQLELFAAQGIEATVTVPFSLEVANLSPQGFLDAHLHVDCLELAGICVGSSWRFGAGGTGDVAFLEAAGARYGFTVMSVGERQWYGKAISSTRVRQAIVAGQLGKAARLLGRPHAVWGHVIHGKGMGVKRLHCATANLLATRLLLPPNGVYAARARIAPERGPSILRPGIAYIGHAPTLDPEHKAPRMLEFHFFEPQQDLYGQQLEVVFEQSIRPDRCLPSVAALRAQVKADIVIAKGMLRGPTSVPVPAVG